MTDQERQRLAAILGMLGSDHAGERAAAALQAEAFRKRHGLTWSELLALSPAAPPPEPAPAAPPPPAPQPAPQPKRPPTYWKDMQLLVWVFIFPIVMSLIRALMH